MTKSKKSKEFVREPGRHVKKLESTVEQVNKILDGLIEGVQIIDFHWRYSYVNETIARREDTTREKLIGQSITERYPGLVLTDMFKVLEQCMFERKATQSESEFTYPDQSKAWLQLNVEPTDQGIVVHSIDITNRRSLHEKVIKINRLNSFIAQVNQKIVRVND